MKTETELARQLATQLKQIIGDDQLWSIKDIADYIGYSVSTVRGRIIVQSDFPVSVRIPYGKGSLTDRRWYPAEVKQWISRHRSKH